MAIPSRWLVATITIVALAALGVGTALATVNYTEVGDEESHYEIEVTLDDGRQVDVQFTEDFEVVGLD